MPSLPAILAFVLDGGGGRNAGMLAALLPPGQLWPRDSKSSLGRLLLASADEIDRIDARVVDMLNEADSTTATELLPEYERDFAVTAAPTLAERRANITAKRVRRQRVRPVDFQQALAPLLQQDPADVVIIERTAAQAAAMGDAREIFRFFVYRNPSLPGTAFIASAQTLVTSMAQSHTVGTVIESTSMLFDDPHSLFDRDLLGA